MADFSANKRFETVESSIKVDAGLPVGSYLFQLTVVDDSGSRSKPASTKVNVIKRLTIDDRLVIDPLQPILRDPILRDPN